MIVGLNPANLTDLTWLFTSLPEFRIGTFIERAGCIIGSCMRGVARLRQKRFDTNRPRYDSIGTEEAQSVLSGSSSDRAAGSFRNFAFEKPLEIMSLLVSWSNSKFAQSSLKIQRTSRVRTLAVVGIPRSAGALCREGDSCRFVGVAWDGVRSLSRRFLHHQF